MRRSVDRFCRNCGYEFSRDDTGDECVMCARFEQVRIQSAGLRASEIPSPHTSAEEPLGATDQLQSVRRPATQSEWGVVFADYRARAASANTRSGSPTASMIRTPAQSPPAGATTEVAAGRVAVQSPAGKTPRSRRRKRPETQAPEAELAESPAPPDKPPSRRTKPAATQALAAGLAEAPAPAKKPRSRRRKRADLQAPTAEVAAAPAGPELESVPPHPQAPAPRPSGWPGPVLIRLRTEPEPASVTPNAPPTALADAAQAQSQTSIIWDESGPTSLPPPDDAPSWSAAGHEASAAAAAGMVVASPEAGRVSRGGAIRRYPASAIRWAASQTAFWVVVASALMGALVALFMTR